LAYYLRIPSYSTPSLASWSDTVSLHDALPIYSPEAGHIPGHSPVAAGSPEAAHSPDRNRPAAHHNRVSDHSPVRTPGHTPGAGQDRKSTRLNSSHVSISYAVFCLEQKNVCSNV